MMKSRVSAILTVLLAGFTIAVSGSAYAGGGSGCIYGGKLAEVQGQQPLVAADADNTTIDPKWLKLLEQQEVADTQNPHPVIHN